MGSSFCENRSFCSERDFVELLVAKITCFLLDAVRNVALYISKSLPRNEFVMPITELQITSTYSSILNTRLFL